MQKKWTNRMVAWQTCVICIWRINQWWFHFKHSWLSSVATMAKRKWNALVMLWSTWLDSTRTVISIAFARNSYLLFITCIIRVHSLARTIPIDYSTIRKIFEMMGRTSGAKSKMHYSVETWNALSRFFDYTISFTILFAHQK